MFGDEKRFLLAGYISICWYQGLPVLSLHQVKQSIPVIRANSGRDTIFLDAPFECIAITLGTLP
jgi:hypothetical protein